MSDLAPPRTLAAEDLPYLGPEEGRCELVGGEIVREPPPGETHGWVAANALIALGRFIHEHRLGRVYAAETGFVLARDPDTVRAPDAAFVAAERLSARERLGPYFEGAPDLAVEVLSPGDDRGAALRKVEDYLAAGCRTVWLIEPAARTVTAHRPGTEPETLGEGQVLHGDPTLPGFRLPVADLFLG